MNELFDPLRRLLLDVCAPVKSEEGIKQIKHKLHKVNPASIMKLATIEFLAPLLYYQLKSLSLEGYEPIMPRLKDSYLRNTARNLLLLKQIKLLKRQAEKEGIKIVLLKGAALSTTIYNEIGLRPMTDVDILVEQQDIERIRSMMQYNNMHPLFNDINQNWLYSIKSHIMPYQSDDNILSLEVHTRLFDDRFIHFKEIDPFDKLHTAHWDNESFFTPEPYIAFIYMLYHTVIHHNFSFRLRDVVDLQYMVSYFKLDMGELLSYVYETHAPELFLPLINAAFEPLGIRYKQSGKSTSISYLYWENSVVMKYVPIQLTSRLSDATLRITILLTSRPAYWLSRIFRFTDYEISIFYKSKQPHGIFKKIGMGLWILIVAIAHVLCYPIFRISRFIVKKMYSGV
ncbi:MAG: nucleotidyltransferase family protein [bacterium]